MSLGEIFSILMAIVGVATVYVVVSSKNTSSIIKSFGQVFQASLSTAIGNPNVSIPG